MVARREAERYKKNVETMRAQQHLCCVSLAQLGVSYAQAASNTLPRSAAPQVPQGTKLAFKKLG